MRIGESFRIVSYVRCLSCSSPLHSHWKRQPSVSSTSKSDVDVEENGCRCFKQKWSFHFIGICSAKWSTSRPRNERINTHRTSFLAQHNRLHLVPIHVHFSTIAGSQQNGAHTGLVSTVTRKLATYRVPLPILPTSMCIVYLKQS